LSGANQNDLMISVRYERERIALLEVLDELTGDEPVPTCPGWTTADVVRHLIGLCDDWLTGRLEVYASADWTAEQVAHFADTPARDLRREWDTRAVRLGEILDDPSARHLPAAITTSIGRLPTASFPGGVLVDLAQHSADVTSAANMQPVLAPETVTGCNRAMTWSIGQMWLQAELPTVAVRTNDGGEEYQLGDGDPMATLEVASYDLFRTLGGRRTIEQTTALDWTGNHEAIATVAPRLVVPFFSGPSELAESQST